MRRNRVVFIISFLFQFTQLLAQNPQSWINYNQTYYKISTASNSPYQLTYNDLLEVGIPLATIDARAIRMYHRGEEVAIRITGQNDGRIDQGDVIQFLGKSNDGVSDTPLYQNPSDQAHQYYNLFSDTTAYFLTWRLDGTAGKRMIERSIVNNTSSLAAEESILQSKLQLYTQNGDRGQRYSPQDDVYKSSFDLGEGWTGSAFTASTDFTLSNIVKENRSAALPELEVLIQGRNMRLHQTEILVGPNTGNLRSIGVVNFEEYQYQLLNAELQWEDINTDGTMVVRAIPQAEGADRISLSYSKLDYQRNADLENESGIQFSLNPNPNSESYVSFTNTNSSARLYRVDIYNEPELLLTNRNGSEINTVVQNTLNGAKLYIQNQNFLSPKIEKVSFRNLANLNPDYVIISHPQLMRPSGEYSNPVAAYSAYRASTTGGGYDTLTVDINRLYNQFNYGEISPLAVYRFTEYLVQNTKAKMVFIIGKGTNWYHNYYRRNEITDDLYNDFVPPAGSPGSDNLYGFDLIDNARASISFGRLNAHNSQIVANYLDKIKDMESQEFDDLRRKHFLNLSGGVSFTEVNRYINYINDFASAEIRPYIGGDYSNLTKETTQVVEFINVSEEINKGVNLITFFGHSSPNTADIDIGLVSNENLGYENQGKYPFILINGCDAGAIYQIAKNADVFGENWINTANKGALGMIAHSYLGFSNELKRYSDIFFAKAYNDSVLINEPIGIVHKAITNSYLDIFGANPSPLYISQAQQMNLMGDPAFKLFPAEKPDYEITDESLEVVSFDGNEIDALTSEFGIDVIINNYGITVEDSLAILVKRNLPNGEIIVQDTQYVAPVYYQDTVQIKVINNRPESFGQNIFEVIIDPAGKVDELNENNNTAQIEFFISLGTTLNLYPYNDGIINNQNITLKTQSIDLKSPVRDFLFQLDTVPTFNSPYLQSQTINARVIAEWQVYLLAVEDQNYYWRSKFANPQAGELDEWSNSNFVYNSNLAQGWRQNSINQISKNNIEGITISNTWSFEENNFDLSVVAPANSQTDNISIKINGNEYATFGSQLGPCAINTLNLVAFDKSTGVPYVILSNGSFDVLDPLSCGIRPQVINQIRNEQLAQPEEYFKKYFDELAEDDFVLISSYDSVAWNVLRANNRTELLNLGASSSAIDNLQNGEPYILLGRKGAGEGNGIEVLADANSTTSTKQQTINLDDIINARFESGSIVSRIIGPAKSWDLLDANFINVEASDIIRIDVFGIDTLSNQALLFSDVNLPLNISNINAELYPQLRLRINFSDPTNLTPAELTNWEVTHTEVPDILILPTQDTEEMRAELAEGEVYNASFQLFNVTPNDFDDPIILNREIFNRESRQTFNEKIQFPALLSESDTTFSLGINSEAKVGENDLILKLNDNNSYSEKRFSNNLLNYNRLFMVQKDSLPPLIEVTFDGISILDGDIVSPQPFIQIELKDENQLIQKKDTTGIEMELLEQCEGCLPQRINFSSPNVEWIPASEENAFTINYQPNPLEDGNYQLRVRATDASENTAGEEPYKVRFEVVNASTITNFYPYPNPFSTSTRFVFTLTGSDLPQEIKIQILTVTGRVVREILQDEIGPIHIGNNITDYAWDGKDEFGDRLANGVYLYRVLVRKDGAFMEQRATAGDKAFTKGYGKLYILR
ncbi:putative type IX secretion system sortase PorU2 [Marivirga arenosa]|uniref:C25 family cysteine peptidase n=1 Tax=Marivirga arenosa TaxID=3059076 RepID=A0AA52F020_9BACT|nr:C25 family cysteine peptidase [Marivirga sp. BKB1-2]WNB18652.1 C25 family cysteine peptidase [Marivirga sp. BKB1-2]